MTAPLNKAIVIGVSAGAVEALSTILPPLPFDYPLPIMIVVHLPPDKKSLMVQLIQSRCKIQVKEADDKEPIVKGTIYLAPPNYHLQVENNKTLSLSGEEPVLFSRPSIDILFETAADTYGPDLTGIILTGANSDGAKGLKAVVNAGGNALIEQPSLAYASAMPQAALKACPTAEVLSLSQITDYIKKVAQNADTN